MTTDPHVKSASEIVSGALLRMLMGFSRFPSMTSKLIPDSPYGDGSIFVDFDVNSLTTARQTKIFIGMCPDCTIPARVEIEDERRDYAWGSCPDCNNGPMIHYERLYATLTEGSCDSRCMGASGQICNCACGGINHAGVWARNKIKLEERASYIESLLQDRIKRAERKQKREATKREQKKSEFQSWLDSIDNELERDALIELIEGETPENDFLDDLRSRLIRNEILTEKQSAAVFKVMQREQRRAENKAKGDAEPKKPCPSGRIELAGEIISQKIKDDGWGGRLVYKILIKCDGFKVWGSCPRDLQSKVFAADGWNEDGKSTGHKRGLKIKLRATVKPKEGDESFGFFSRPVDARLVGEIPTITYEPAKSPIMNGMCEHRGGEIDFCGGGCQSPTIVNIPDVIGTRRTVWTGPRQVQTGVIVGVNGITRSVLDREDGTRSEYSKSDLMLPEHYKGETLESGSETLSKTPRVSPPQDVQGDAPAPVASSSKRASGSHADCTHESTKSARAKCRRERNAK